MTHKVRRIKDYLSYQQLPQQDEMGQKFTAPQARRQRRSQIQNDAYEIYNASSREEAQQRLSVFVEKWKSLEPKAVQAFQREIDLTKTFYEFALPLHRRIRTSNLLERLERRVSAQV